jgi:hypothetical protein
MSNKLSSGLLPKASSRWMDRTHAREWWGGPPLFSQGRLNDRRRPPLVGIHSNTNERFRSSRTATLFSQSIALLAKVAACEARLALRVIGSACHLLLGLQYTCVLVIFCATVLAAVLVLCRPADRYHSSFPRQLDATHSNKTSCRACSRTFSIASKRTSKWWRLCTKRRTSAKSSLAHTKW